MTRDLKLVVFFYLILNFSLHKKNMKKICFPHSFILSTTFRALLVSYTLSSILILVYVWYRVWFDICCKRKRKRKKQKERIMVRKEQKWKKTRKICFDDCDCDKKERKRKNIFPLLSVFLFLLDFYVKPIIIIMITKLDCIFPIKLSRGSYYSLSLVSICL